MTHLNQSLALFFGFMASSYYSSHYMHERKMLSHWDLKKHYFEQRARFEVAFLAAFKAIERFLQDNDLRKGTVSRALTRLRYKDIKPDTKYVRWFEIYSGYPRRSTYCEMIKHFLEMRNVVAAHGNRNPPRRFFISQDNLYEIQAFVAEMFCKAIDAVVGQTEGT